MVNKKNAARHHKITVTFLGGGRITWALLEDSSSVKRRYRIVVHDRNPGRLRRFKKLGIAVEKNLQRAVAGADLLIIAVRPDAVVELLTSVGRVDRPIIAVSLAAAVPLRILTKAMGKPVHWARAMPSPACRDGHGLTALSFSSGISRVGREYVVRFFSSLGPVLRLSENRLDAFTVTYSPSHGYHALLALAEAGRRIGLDWKTALSAGAHALGDGVAAWREARRPLAAMVREAATPGGIAAATMAAANSAGYQRAVDSGLAAGLARARQLRQQIADYRSGHLSKSSTE